LIATLIIISILSYTQFFYSKPTKITIKHISNNYEEQIIYIKKNFGYQYIPNYTNSFQNYSYSLGYNFSYIIISTYKLSLRKCLSNSDINCYFYYSDYFDLSNISLCNINKRLYFPPNIICICYSISKDNESYKNFFCT